MSTLTMHEEGFDVVVYSTINVNVVKHNGRGHKNTIETLTHLECVSIIPEVTEDEYMTNRVFIASEKKKPTTWRESMNADDFGPQRFSAEGEPLDMSSDNGLWIDPDGNILADETYNPLRDDFGVPIPNGRLDLFDEVKCSRDKSVKDSVERFNLEYYLDDNGKLDIYKLKQAKLPRDLAKFIWTNRDTLEYAFRDIDKEWNENVPNTYMEEVNSSDDEDTESNISDIGISNEEGTHQTKEQLKFWKGILWYVGHYVKGGKTKAREAVRNGTITLDEYRYIITMLNYGVSNSKWNWVVSGFSNIRKSKRDPKYLYSDIIDPFYKFYKPTPRKTGITHINYKYETVRAIHFFEPTESMKQGFILMADYDAINGLHNIQQHRVLGDKAVELYHSKIHESLMNKIKTITKNVRKESKEPVMYSKCWNMWLESPVNYFKTMKSLLK